MRGSGPDVLVSHGPDGLVILLRDRLGGAFAFDDVAVETAIKAQAIGCLDEDLQVAERADFREVKREDPFEDDE